LISRYKIMKILTKNVEKIYGREKLWQKLKSGKKITVYFGIDPSADKLHFGHAIGLRKLREFQDQGHKVILLLGDFTGMIGDPTDRLATRRPMTQEEVRANAKNYKKQASKILRFRGENAAQIKFNSLWLGKMNFADLVELASHLSVQRLLERDMFERRMKEGKAIHLHEFLYPLMQGYDSVALDVDLEIGSRDQTFNMLVGRTLMRKLKKKEKAVLTYPLLSGLDGRKMSKTAGNIVALDAEPKDMYGKIMSVRDELIPEYFELCANAEKFEVKEVKKELKMGANPRDVKARLAHMIVKMYHGEKKALEAESEFKLVFREKKVPEKIPQARMKEGICEDLPGLLFDLSLAPSKSQARRLIEQGAVKIDGSLILDITAKPCIHNGMVIQVGKRHFVRIVSR